MGFWLSHARPQGSPAVLHSSLPLPLPSEEDGCSPHCTLTRVSACWMCYSREQGHPCLLGSLYCLLHLRGFRKGEPYVPVALLAVGNREPLHSHCVPVSWKDQSLCVCVGDTACLVTLRLERCCAHEGTWPGLLHQDICSCGRGEAQKKWPVRFLVACPRLLPAVR